MTAWLTVTQAATRLGVGVRTLRRWLVDPANPLRSRLRNGVRQIHVDDVDSYVRPQMGGKR